MTVSFYELVYVCHSFLYYQTRSDVHHCLLGATCKTVYQI